MSLFDFGLEMSEIEEKEMIDIPNNYEYIRDSEFEDKDTFSGEPSMSEIQEGNYDKGYINLVLINHAEERWTRISFTLNSEGPIQKDVSSRTKLFPFIQSLRETAGEPVKGNIIKRVNVQDIIDLINDKMDDMTVVADFQKDYYDKEGELKRSNYFRVVDFDMDED